MSLECLICIEDINDDNYLILECCNKKVHILCLNKWIETNLNNKQNINKCFYCNQNNDLINFMGNPYINNLNMIEESNINILENNIDIEIEIDNVYIKTFIRTLIYIIIFLVFLFIFMYLCIFKY